MLICKTYFWDSLIAGFQTRYCYFYKCTIHLYLQCRLYFHITVSQMSKAELIKKTGRCFHALQFIYAAFIWTRKRWVRCYMSDWKSWRLLVPSIRGVILSLENGEILKVQSSSAKVYAPQFEIPTLTLKHLTHHLIGYKKRKPTG